MEIKYLDEKDTWIIKINNDLDLYTVPELRKAVTECIAQKETDFVLDCSEMGFIDSTGLGELAGLMKSVKKYYGTISITGLKPHIKKVFLITGLNTIFNIDGEDNG